MKWMRLLTTFRKNAKPSIFLKAADALCLLPFFIGGNVMSVFSVWKDAIKHRKRDKWLIGEFPKLALAQFKKSRNLMPSASKEELYETVIHSFAEMFGVSYENRDKYTR